MKIWPILGLALALTVSVQAQTVSNKLFWIAFDYPAAEFSTNITFRAHFNWNMELPIALSAWPIANTGAWLAESTNAGLITFVSSNKILATAPKTFFVVSASNEWGIVFSDVLATGPPAKTGAVRLR